MTSENLAALLAKHVMGWSVGPERFLTGNRSWMPRWRFQPTEKLVDALRLLDAAHPAEYIINSRRDGPFTVRVQIGAATGKATDTSKARAITHAVARAIGLE